MSETEIVTPESSESEGAEDQLPTNCRKCPYFKHANKFYCYNPPEDGRGPGGGVDGGVEARVVIKPSEGRMDWCQLEKEVEGE